MSLENIFTLPSEYNDLRDSVRSLSDNEIAPHAHAVDEDHRYPREAHDALVKAGLFAAHVPTEFGGDGADALAACIIIEEVARVCASSSLIPAVNKLGSLPLILGGNKEQKERWLRPLAKGKGFSYCLSESEAGSDASSLKTKAERQGDGWVINGSKKWISNAGESEFTQSLHRPIHHLVLKESLHLSLRNLIPVFHLAHPRRRWASVVHLHVRSTSTMSLSEMIAASVRSVKASRWQWIPSTTPV